MHRKLARVGLNSLHLTTLVTVVFPLLAHAQSDVPSAVASEMVTQFGDLSAWPPYSDMNQAHDSVLSSWRERLAVQRMPALSLRERVLKSALLEVLAEAEEMRACGWYDSSEPLTSDCYQAWLRYHLGQRSPAEALFRQVSDARVSLEFRSGGPTIREPVPWAGVAPDQFMLELNQEIARADERARVRSRAMFFWAPSYHAISVAVGTAGGVAAYRGQDRDGVPRIGVDSTVARNWGPADIYRITAHEIWPGHHLMATRSSERIHSLFRGYSPTGFAEGWATYAEVLVNENGKGEPSAEMRSHLGLLALLAQVDLGIHHRGWSRKVATDTLIAGGYSRQEAKAIIDDIVLRPGRHASYYLGYEQFQTLRQEAETAWGDGFSLPRFHEAVLRYGPLPFKALSDLVRNWGERSPGR